MFAKTLPTLAALASVLTTTLANNSDHFILTSLSTIAMARLDPIVNPGEVSGHLHNIVGGSCFNENLNTPEEQQDCDCSSAIIGADKSNYWAPSLMYQYPNGTFVPMLGSTRIYYFTRGDPVPFPPGLRMITGMAMSRNVSDTRSFGLRISCNHGLEGSYLPNGTSHPEGCKAIAMGIFFPSCGDGRLDSPDHFSHMTWPYTSLGGVRTGEEIPSANSGPCPASHPIKYPTIFMQANYYPTADQPWHSGNPVILSTGDQSGLGYHADFIDGWDQQTLKDTLAQCGEGKGVGEGLANCPPLAKSLSMENSWACRYQNKIPNEDIGLYRPIAKLPGCNKVWPTDGPDTKPECVEENKPTLIYPNAQYVNLKYRKHIPTLFTEAANLSDTTALKAFIPGLGDNTASYLRAWDYDGTNKDALKMSTITEILDTKIGGPDYVNDDAKTSAKPAQASVVPSSITSSAAASATTALPGTNVNLGIDGEEPVASSSASKAAASSASKAEVSIKPTEAASPSASSAIPAKASSAASASKVESAAAEKPTTSVKTCHRTKRGLMARSRDLGHEVKLHVARRSRRQKLSH